MTSDSKQADMRPVNFKLDPKNRATIERISRECDEPTDREIYRALRISQIRTLFRGRHGKHLPDTVVARKHLLALLRHLAAIPRIRKATLFKEVQRWAAWMSASERSELVHTALLTPRVHRADKLGRLFGLVDAERIKFGTWTIWPIDLSLAEAKLRSLEHDKAYQAAKRRAAGCQPHSESLARTKPWVAEGISRTEWFERRKAAKERNSIWMISSVL
jgi:hypothetical protein